MQATLPVEAYEGLFLVAAGDTVEPGAERTRDAGRPRRRSDGLRDRTDDPESQSRFVVVDDDEAMLAIMNAPLAQWRVFLHPTQRKLATGDRSGPVRVLGGAGTGKTVLAMHRAKWLAENRTPDGQEGAVHDVYAEPGLRHRAEPEARCAARSTLAKIEVRNLDAWVHGFMRAQKLEHRIVYDRKQDADAAGWQAAMAVRTRSSTCRTTSTSRSWSR